MKATYYSAIERATKPFVSFQSIGSFTDEEFETSAHANDPLVVKESNLPGYAFGVCLAKIVSGELVTRTPAELAVFEQEYNTMLALRTEAARIATINQGSFLFDGHNFPMDEVSRLFYLSIEKTIPSSAKIRTMANTAYALESTDITAFLTAYYNQLYLNAKHTI